MIRLKMKKNYLYNIKIKIKMLIAVTWCMFFIGPIHYYISYLISDTVGMTTRLKTAKYNRYKNVLLMAEISPKLLLLLSFNMFESFYNYNVGIAIMSSIISDIYPNRNFDNHNIFITLALIIKLKHIYYIPLLLLYKYNLLQSIISYYCKFNSLFFANILYSITTLNYDIKYINTYIIWIALLSLVMGV